MARSKITGLDEVFANLDKFKRRQENAARFGAELTAMEMEAYAKRNRNWKDRTNIARLGLTGSWDYDGTIARVALAQTPHYGVWLELANAGKYAIIERTIRAHRRKFQENVKRLGRV